MCQGDYVHLYPSEFLANRLLELTLVIISTLGISWKAPRKLQRGREGWRTRLSKQVEVRWPEIAA